MPYTYQGPRKAKRTGKLSARKIRRFHSQYFNASQLGNVCLLLRAEAYAVDSLGRWRMWKFYNLPQPLEILQAALSLSEGITVKHDRCPNWKPGDNPPIHIPTKWG